MDREAIRLEHITKIYKLYNRNRDRLKDALGLTRKKCYSEHYALKDVSMTIRQGKPWESSESTVPENLRF